jgi:hypothetical protein
MNRFLVVGAVLLGLLSGKRAMGQEMPDDVREALGRLVGTWKAEEKCEDAVAKADFVVEWNPGETALIWHWKGQAMNAPDETVTASGIMGWDGHKGVVFEQGFTSTGEAFSATHKISKKKWTSPTQATILVDGTFQKEKSLRVITFKSDDIWELATTKRTWDGKEQPDALGVSTRVK